MENSNIAKILKYSRSNLLFRFLIYKEREKKLTLIFIYSFIFIIIPNFVFLDVSTIFFIYLMICINNIFDMYYIRV